MENNNTATATSKRERHNCGGNGWMTCTACDKRIHRPGCTSKLNLKKDCDLKCSEKSMDNTTTDRAFPPHDFYYHGIMTECDVCTHPAQCARMGDTEGPGMADVCRACINEGNAPDGLTVAHWCTECQHTIPAEIVSPNI